MRVRQSDLKTWQRCPLQLKFQKVDGIAREQSAALTFGTVIHASILMMEVTYDLKVGLRAFEQYWTDPEALEPGLTPTEYVKGTSWKKYNDEGPRILERWWEIIQWESDDVIAREHTFSVPIGDHILDGTVDKLAIRYLAPTDEYVLLVSDYKGLALDTPLPTPSGWTSMRDVRVGEQLIGGGGRPCSVIGKSELHQRDCYRITFDDKTSVVCDNEHLWQVEVGYQEPYDQKVMATEDLAQNLFNPVTGQRHLRIPNVELNLPEADLPIDPYVLGAWLGDGAASCGLICKPLPALFAEIARRGYRVGDDVSGPDHAEARTIFGLRGQLREAGLLNNKHVPAAYLRASRQQRLDLLRGIMDTDGHWNPKRRRCVVNVTDERFANEVRELALSLGYGARTFATTANGFGLTVDAWQTWFTPSDEVFIARRPEGFRADAPAKAKRRLIHSIERIPTVTTQCVMVDSPDQTYLCGDQMVVTHNTNRKEPTYGYLFHDLQFSAYCYATTQKEFWTGIQDGEEIWEKLKGARRVGEWVQLTGPRRKDAGERNEMHYARLRYAVNAFAESVSLGIFVPNISGDTCMYCLAGDTEIWTAEGVRAIKDVAGSTQRVLARSGSGGTWVPSEVRSFGVQPVREIHLSRGGKSQRTITATPDHRWFVRDRKDPRRTSHTTKTTDQLAPGDVLLATLPRPMDAKVAPSTIGIQAGIVFGDGCLPKGRDACIAPLYDHKRELAHYFDGHPSTTSVSANGNDLVTVHGLPRFLNDAPDLEEASSYLLGWLMGYVATDGSVSANGKQVTLSSSRREHVELARTVAARLGIGTYGVIVSERLGLGTEPTSLYRIQFVSSTLPDGFFILDRHAQRFVSKDRSDEHVEYTVMDVVDPGREEEVFCATVPEHANFTLEGWINTHNCDFRKSCGLLSREDEERLMLV